MVPATRSQSIQPGGFSFGTAHTYLDDNATDSYAVTITLTDDDGGVAVETRQVTVRNVPPSLSNFTFDASVDTSGVATINGTINGAILDPGSLDTHSLAFDFGDGTPAETIELTSGQSAFSITHAYAVAGTYSIQATLVDDDGGQGTVFLGPLTSIGSISIRSLESATETGRRPGRFIVSQSVATARDTVLRYAVGGTAQSGSDFDPLSGSVTIAAGTTSAQILIPVIDDLDDEGFVNESVELTLLAIESGDPDVILSIENPRASIGIIDNDPDDDADGVGSNVEDPGGQGYDGNHDGLPDSLQSNVVSLPNATSGTYFTIASEAGETLAGVVATANPSPNDAPAGVEFAAGFLEYEIRNVLPGGATTIRIFTAPGASFTTYYKYGPTPDELTPHWYEFLYDGTTGAEIAGNVITLHFVDGRRGDDDLTANGVIVDPGAPGGAAPPVGAPRAHAGGPYLADEGATITLDASGTSYPNELNASLTFEWDLHYDGQTFDVEAHGIHPTVSFPDNLAAHTIAVRATDSNSVSVIATAAVHVFNLTPFISHVESSNSELSHSSADGHVTIKGTFDDLGLQDTHEVLVDWGDGTPPETLASEDVDQVADAFDALHTYLRGGIFTIQVTVVDDDGGKSIAQTTQALVQGVGVNGGVLQVIGSDADDKITIRPKSGEPNTLTIRVKRHGSKTTEQEIGANLVNSIHVLGGGGNDIITIGHDFTLAALIDAGDGDDLVFGGSGPDVIYGGAGDDKLFGRHGHDQIFGEQGNDWIWGNQGSDLLVGGDGNDKLFGQFGNDVLWGGLGNDTLDGGDGLDLIFKGWHWAWDWD